MVMDQMPDWYKRIGLDRELTVMTVTRRLLLGLGALLLVLAVPGCAPAWAAAGKIRIAFGDIATVETLNFLIAVERAKERGVDIEVTYFKSEDIAAQAVVGGQADVGVGAPYTLLQKVKAPIRIFFQMSTLRFFPVVNTEFYQDWKDLDGQEIAVHSRGSGTEAIMQLMAQRNGHQLLQHLLRAGLGGADDRRCCRATSRRPSSTPTNMRILEQQGGGKFKAAADRERRRHRRGALRQHRVPRARAGGGRHPGRGADRDLARDQPGPGLRRRAAEPSTTSCRTCRPSSRPRSSPTTEDAVASGVYPNNGGGAEAAKADFEFNALAGKLEGDPATLKVEDFWALGPLNRALAKLGQG